MDLSFSRFEHDAKTTIMPPDLAVMMVGIAARQAASPTAIFHAHLGALSAAALRFAPRHGAFNAAMAAALVRWKEL
ncbi:hypothetical protein [Sphingomonas hylomeconis]|uniref:Uncharacterized protein n=1 Tax=Sphingomonas hylomeconis TaxID=1395958 RepID=A0ABV7SSP9_9SPHN|nr:hypothetical protein [Sphingomonas hylomeconis]